MTNTDICNLALSYLSKGRIVSIDDNTEEAAQCKIHYDHCRRMLLRQYPWGFAKRTVKLAQLHEKVPGWEYVYAYPAECLCVRYVFEEENAATKENDWNEYETVMVSSNQKALATDIELAWCEYTYNIKDVGMYPDEFIEALAHFMASSMAMVLTGSAAIQQTEYQLYQNCIEAAKTFSAQEQRRKSKYPLTYAEARFD